MGGHVAEEIMYGENNVTAGCSSDLSKATQVAQLMIKNLGMYSKDVGYLYVEEDKSMYDSKKVSEKYKSAVDEMTAIVLKDSHDRVENMIKTNSNDIKNLAQKLFQYDTLSVNEIEDILEGKFNPNRQKAREAYKQPKPTLL
jgi:ATP-dependent Zn protease